MATALKRTGLGIHMQIAVIVVAAQMTPSPQALPSSVPLSPHLDSFPASAIRVLLSHPRLVIGRGGEVGRGRVPSGRGMECGEATGRGPGRTHLHLLEQGRSSRPRK